MKVAYPYIRFSSTEQRKGNSLDRQLKEVQQWCEKNNAVLDDSLDFMKELGKSAFTGENLAEGGGLGLFLAAVRAKKVSTPCYLLVEKLDRFSRTDVDIALHFFGQVLRAGVTIVSMRSGTEYTVEMLRRQPTSILTAVLELILANEESVKKSDRLLSAWAKKRAKARNKVPMTKRGPLWLRLSGVEGTGHRGDNGECWEVIEDRAEVVRRIFTLTAEGMGGYRLAALLNKQGVKPMENLPHWTQRAVTRILHNRAVLGEFQPQKKVDGKPEDDGPAVPGYFPAVVDVGLFHRAHQQMKAQQTGGRKAGGRQGKLSLFQKLAFDSDSGSTLVVRSTKGGKKTGYIRYLMPSSGLRGGVRWTVPIDVFEKSLLSGLSDLNFSEILGGNSEARKELDEVQGRAKELARLIDETTRAMDGQPAAYLGSIVAKVAAWEEEKAALTKKEEELSALLKEDATSPADELKEVVARMESGGEEGERVRAKVRSLIRRLVSRVTVKVKPGKDRLHKTVLACVEFHRCNEKRIFMFTTPPTTVVVVSGMTAEDFGL